MLCLLVQLAEILGRKLFCAKLALKIVELQTCSNLLKLDQTRLNMLCLLVQLTEILGQKLFCAKLTLKIVELQMFCFKLVLTCSNLF
jgi:hypothetical protein